jgi:XTP/dITP diphosphohydrolase
LIYGPIPTPDLQNQLPNRIVLATHNAGKVVELRHALHTLPITLCTASDYPELPEVVEDAPTLEGNARKKALSLHEHAGLPALADDTGLEVEALDGRPGVYTARYAGPDATPADNRALMLKELATVTNRAARFRTVIAFAEAGEVLYFEGCCDGRILEYERGEGGFGYDAIFVPDGLDLTFAELDKTPKNAISHRGRALDAFLAYIEGRQTA